MEFHNCYHFKLLINFFKVYTTKQSTNTRVQTCIPFNVCLIASWISIVQERRSKMFTIEWSNMVVMVMYTYNCHPILIKLKPRKWRVKPRTYILKSLVKQFTNDKLPNKYFTDVFCRMSTIPALKIIAATSDVKWIRNHNRLISRISWPLVHYQLIIS